MRALALTTLLSLAGCYAYYEPEPAYAPPPPETGPMPGSGPRAGPPGAERGPPQEPGPPRAGAERLQTEQQAVEFAFRVARDRGLEVDRVKSAQRDGSGRWQIELEGSFDRARLLLDARDGRLLKGKFRAKAGRPRQ